MAFEQLRRPFDFTIKRNFNSAICHAVCSCAAHWQHTLQTSHSIETHTHTHTYTLFHFNAVTFSQINKTCLKWQPAFHTIKLLSFNAERERGRDLEAVTECVWGGVCSWVLLLRRMMCFLGTAHVCSWVKCWKLCEIANLLNSFGPYSKIGSLQQSIIAVSFNRC